MKMRAVLPQNPFPATLSFDKTPAARQASCCNNSYADPLAKCYAALRIAWPGAGRAVVRIVLRDWG